MRQKRNKTKKQNKAPAKDEAVATGLKGLSQLPVSENPTKATGSVATEKQSTMITQDSPTKAGMRSVTKTDQITMQKKPKAVQEDEMEDDGSNTESDGTNSDSSDKEEPEIKVWRKAVQITSTAQNLNIDSLKIPRNKKHISN